MYEYSQLEKFTFFFEIKVSAYHKHKCVVLVKGDIFLIVLTVLNDNC